MDFSVKHTCFESRMKNEREMLKNRKWSTQINACEESHTESTMGDRPMVPSGRNDELYVILTGGGLRDPIASKFQIGIRKIERKHIESITLFITQLETSQFKGLIFMSFLLFKFKSRHQHQRTKVSLNYVH